MKKLLSSLLLALTVLITVSPAFADECNLYTTENSSACWINGDGICYNDSGYIGTGYIQINPNTAYTVYAELISSPGNTHGVRIAFYDANKNFISPRFGDTVGSAGEYVFNVTSPANAAYIRVSSGNQSVVSKTIIVQGTYTKDNIPTNLGQCSVCHAGQVSRQYESAVGTVSQNGTPTPTNPIEPVFYTQGNMVLRKIDDTYYDSYDATTGKITRRVGVKVLNGTEDWINDRYSSGLSSFETPISNLGPQICSHYIYGFTWGSRLADGAFGARGIAEQTYFKDDRFTSVPDLKQYLAQQYAAGTPVTVYYPLAEPVEETPASTTYCADAIKIATTAYNAAAFAPVEAALESAVTTIKDVVANTIVQADAIQNLQDTKQTMPDASGTNGTCPRFRQCLLIETDDGTPQWFQIADPVYDLISSLKNNKVNNSGQTTNDTFAANGYDGTNNTTDSRYYKGYPAMRLQTDAHSSSVYTRQFVEAGLSGNQYKTLGDQEWAVTWDGNETGTAGSFLAGVIYGTSRCSKTKPSSTAVGTEGWTTIENSDALNDLEHIEEYIQCYCKMTGVGLDGMITPVKNSSAAPWVFLYTSGSAGNCALYCAYYCAYDVRANASFRSVVLGWAVE